MCLDLINRIKNVFNKDDGDSGKATEVHSVRVFAVSPMNPKIYADATIYQIQEQSQDKSDQKIKIKELHDFIQSKYAMEMTMKMLIDQKSTVISKMIQNLYVTSLGGITGKSMKVYRISLMINATNDLPNIDEEKIEMIRVPLNSVNASLVEGFLDDVADKIQATSFKNISTLIYCYDGMCNSLVLVACYFIKYTDLMLVEIAQHLAFSRKGYQQDNGFGPFTDMVIRFARKYSKVTDDDETTKFASSGQITKPNLLMDSAASNDNMIIAMNSERGNERQERSNVGKYSSIKTASKPYNEKSHQSVSDKLSDPSAKSCNDKEPSGAWRKGNKSVLSEQSPKDDKRKSDDTKDKSEKKSKQIKEQSTKTQQTEQKRCLSAPEASKKDEPNRTKQPEIMEKFSLKKNKPKKDGKKDKSKREMSNEKLSKKTDKNSKKTSKPGKKPLKKSQDINKKSEKSTKRVTKKDTKSKKNTNGKKSLVKTAEKEKEKKSVMHENPKRYAKEAKSDAKGLKGKKGKERINSKDFKFKMNEIKSSKLNERKSAKSNRDRKSNEDKKSNGDKKEDNCLKTKIIEKECLEMKMREKSSLHKESNKSKKNEKEKSIGNNAKVEENSKLSDTERRKDKEKVKLKETTKSKK